MSTTTFPKHSLRETHTIAAGRYRLELGERTLIMGIVNVTPDSFSQDGCLSDSSRPGQKAIALAKKHIREGADIIDIGGESTRPGSKRVPLLEERERVIPVVAALTKSTTVPISVDTYKSQIAQEALDAGATIINNIMGVKSQKSLLKMVKNYNAAVVLMHLLGTPRTMQNNIQYTNLLEDIMESLQHAIDDCLEIGLRRDQIIIDPGFGFGKTVEHNLEILNRLEEFHRLKQPILIGTSRKSFIGKVLNQDISHRLMGTAATISTGILNGAHIVRVHDVARIKDVVRMTDAITHESYPVE